MLCVDVDIVKQEYGLFVGTVGAFAAQVLTKGNAGQVSGTTFLVTGESFTSKGIAAGHVLYLSDGVGNIDGVYEIVSVDSATQLTVSVVRADDTQAAIPVGTGTSLTYRIKTFDPQIKRAEFEISQLLQMKPGVPDGQYGLDDLADPDVLKEAAVYWTLSLICAAMVGVEDYADSADTLNEKRTMYQEMAESAIGRCRLSFTT